MQFNVINPQVPESKKNALALIVKTKDDTIKNFLIGFLGLGLNSTLFLGGSCDVTDRPRSSSRYSVLMLCSPTCQSATWPHISPAGRTPTGFHLPPHSSQNLTLLLEELSHPAQAALPVPLLPGFFLNEKVRSAGKFGTHTRLHPSVLNMHHKR